MLKRIALVVICLTLLLFTTGTGSPGWEIAWQSTPDLGLGSAGRNYRNILPAGTSAFSGSKIRITVTAWSWGAATLDGTSVGLMTTADDMDDAIGDEDEGTFQRITWEGDNDGVSCNADQEKVSDEITFAFDKTERYGFHIYMVDRENWSYDESVSDGMYHNTPGADDTLTQTVGYTPLANMTAIITKIEVYVDENGNGEENAIFFGINFLLASLLLIAKRRP
jgi:hypothetical protein